MIPVLKSSFIEDILPKRAADSHKGDNGKLLIIGGSLDFYGAPILSALGALYSGVDLVYLFVPRCNFEVTRSLYPDFIVRAFDGDYFSPAAIPGILPLARECNAILMGPGISERPESIEAVRQVLMTLKLPTVLDAAAMYALKQIPAFPLPQPLAVTPHLNEFQKLIDREFLTRDEESLRQKKMLYLQTLSKELHIHIVLKGVHDFITSDKGSTAVNTTGDAGMTVGGSGDVLSGFIASLMAQGSDVFDACCAATHIFGLVGEHLFKTKGYGYLATDLARSIPDVMRKFL
jgi:NAD(P)H-hydrate epimerase